MILAMESTSSGGADEFSSLAGSPDAVVGSGMGGVDLAACGGLLVPAVLGPVEGCSDCVERVVGCLRRRGRGLRRREIGSVVLDGDGGVEGVSDVVAAVFGLDAEVPVPDDCWRGTACCPVDRDELVCSLTLAERV